MQNSVSRFRLEYRKGHTFFQGPFVFRLLIAILFCLAVSAGTAIAATYYVATDGDDNHTKVQAQNIGTPWQTIDHGTSQLSPGDILLVRGGTYRETVAIGVSGTAENRIAIKNYPGERPIIDGSVVMTGWTKCESQEACGGNENWASMYYAYAPAETKVFTANLYQNNEMLSVAQIPNPTDPFYMDNQDDYLIPDSITSTSVTDSDLAGFGGTDLIGSWVAVYITTPHSVNYREILDYNTVDTKITFGEVSGSGHESYSLLNYLDESVLNKAGEYYVTEVHEPNGTHKIYLWPLDDVNLVDTGEVTVSVLTELVKTGDSDYVTFEGFKIQKGINTVITTATSGDRIGVIIKNNEITECRAGTSAANMVYIYNCDDAVFEDNYLHQNAGRLRGFNSYRGGNVKVVNNIIDKQGGTCVFFQTITGGQITGNTVTGSTGSHSNAYSVYQGSSDVLIANNIALGVNWAFTMKESNNLTLYNNLFIGTDNEEHVVASWGGMGGTILVLNNTIYGASKSCALKCTSAAYTVSKNNITEGDIGWEYEDERSHNIYTDGLCERQQAKYGWELETGGIVADGSGEYDINDIFVDQANDYFRLKAGSPAINAGTDISSYLAGIESKFPDFNFDVDIAGNPRRVGTIDIGAYEYVSSDSNNSAPILGAIGDKSVSENSLLSFTISATDADSDTITYSASGLPSGATFSSPFNWTPNYGQAGTYQVTFTASDGTASDSETITITVSNINQEPVLAPIGDKSVSENSTLSFSVSATDADGQAITYSATGLPTGAMLNVSSGAFVWTPGYTQAGTHQVTFTASDGTASDSETITITVNNTNIAPVLSSIGNKSVYTESSLNFSVSATDADSDTITYSATGLPSGATFANQSFSWTPSNSQAGSYDVTFTASDSQTQDSETITITVTADTSAPTVNSLSPAADSIQAPLNSLIYLDVTDSGKGVNASTVTIEVNSNLVYTGNTTDYSSSYGHCRRIGTSAAYTYVYQADEMFDYDQTVTVTVNAADLAANSMDEYSYSFKTEMRSFGENKKANSSSNNLNEGSPATVSDSSGNIRAVWHTGQTGSRDIYAGKLTAGADSFGDSAQVTNDNADQCNPAIAIDSADKLYVVWQDNRNGEWDIYVSTSTDGTNFSSERKVTDPNSDQINPAVVIDSSDKAYIVWEDDRNNNKDIYIASSSNSFVSYATSQITSNASDQIAPAVAVDSGNTVCVVWTDARSGTNDIYGADSTNGPWTNVAVVSNTNNQSSPAIAAEASGTILHLLWVDNTSGNNDIYYASSNGLPGSPLNGSSIIDDDSGADQSAPVITTTGSTGNDLKVFACWKDERNISSGNGDTDIYLVEANSGSGTNVLVGDDGTNSAQSYPAMGIDGYGYPYLVWTDDRNTATNIYYAGSTFVESTALESEDITASSGATVGTELASINSVTDVSITIPAEACSHDTTITISRIKNPPKLTLDNLSTLYEFGPSGIEFDHPVTIIIPYDLSTVGNSPSAYWYNPLTSVLSQQGITDIETVEISSTLHALHFKTTHFTQFLVGGDIAAAAGEGGGGGGWGLSCSMSPNSQGSIVEFLLPYIGLTVVMTILKLQDKHKKKMRDIAKSEC